VPRIAAKERESAISRLEAYLAPVFSDPRADDRPLSIASISRALRISPSTLKKHGLVVRIQEAARLRATVRPEHGSAEVARLKAQLSEQRKTADLWMRRYGAVLEQYLRIEYHLRRSSRIDLDALLLTAIPKPSRIEPRSAGRRRR
jgi:hypothetical protein